MPSGVALVTTVWLRDRARGGRHVDVLSSFLLYHISIGVDRVTVFFDGDATQQPTRETLHADVASLVAHGRIELLYRWEEDADLQGVCSADGRIKLSYADCVNYASLRSAMAEDVASRQTLNAELAMQLYRNRNLANPDTTTRWLLHLDVDELFFCEGMVSSQPPTSTLCEFIAELEAQRPRIHQLTVANYEAVPTTTNGANYFVSATKFRRHTARIPLSSASQKAMRAWQARSPYDQFFLFYDNGKSLVRVPEGGDGSHASEDRNRAMAGVVVPTSVHHWRLEGGARNWRSVANFYDPRRSDVTVWHAPAPALRSCVLHFPVCGVEWLSDKYARLGDFSGVWGGTKTRREMRIAPCFHLQARDAWIAGGVDALETLYEAQVRVRARDDAFWQEQIHSGVCEEITFARELLRSKGFPLASQETTEEEEEETSSSHSSPLKGHSTETPTAGFTVEKAWMLAAISNTYL